MRQPIIPTAFILISLTAALNAQQPAAAPAAARPERAPGSLSTIAASPTAAPTAKARLGTIRVRRSATAETASTAASAIAHSAVSMPAPGSGVSISSGDPDGQLPSPSDALMAARRLLIVLVVLLGVSTLAAALAPVPSQKDSTSTETTTQPIVPTPGELTGGHKQLFEKTIDADSKTVEVIQLFAGEELQLRVRSKLLDQISIPELGQVQAVSPDAPASFDLLLDQPGDYAIRLVDAGRLVGRLEVSPGARPEKGPG
jgi:hypothetical protein